MAQLNSDTMMICREIAQDIVKAAREVMASSIGVNDKVGKNTLADSDLSRQIDWSIQFGDDVVIQTLFNYYIQFIEDGRKPKKGKMPPEDAIIKWMRRKHIVSSNKNIRSVAFLIRRAIRRDGYNARPVIKTLSDRTDVLFDKWAEQLFNSLIKDINDFFTNENNT